MAGRSEHDAVAGGGATIGVRARVHPLPEVRLDLNDPPRESGAAIVVNESTSHQLGSDLQAGSGEEVLVEMHP